LIFQELSSQLYQIYGVKTTDRTIKKRFNNKWKLSKRIKFDDGKFLRARIIYLFYILGVNDDTIPLNGNKNFFSFMGLPAHHTFIGLRFRRYYIYNAGRAFPISLRNAGGLQINVTQSKRNLIFIGRAFKYSIDYLDNRGLH
jgi:hypothetical protein